MSEERFKKVEVDFNTYHKEMNELELLITLVMRLMFNEITLDQFREQLEKENQKYRWWL